MRLDQLLAIVERAKQLELLAETCIEELILEANIARVRMENAERAFHAAIDRYEAAMRRVEEARAMAS